MRIKRDKAMGRNHSCVKKFLWDAYIIEQSNDLGALYSR